MPISRGFTLVEAMSTLAISSILLYLALPSFNSLIDRHHSTSRINGVIGMVRFARQSAITENGWVTLCSAVNQSCSGSPEWHTGVMAFADPDRNGVRDVDERVLAYYPALDSGERLRWRSFRNRNFLQFTPRGYTNWQNGSFHYCPASGNPRFGKVVIINIQGRATPSMDQDGDGIDEQANGSPLTCS
jgi:prepilin-type N-terminal cleavage/methylation domain-containing protein